jgi:hypothetical protein
LILAFAVELPDRGQTHAARDVNPGIDDCYLAPELIENGTGRRRATEEYDDRKNLP